MNAKLTVLLAFGLLLFSGLAAASSHDDTPGGDQGDEGREDAEDADDRRPDSNTTDDGDATDDRRAATDRPGHGADECAAERDEELAEAQRDLDDAIADAREDRDEELDDNDSDAEDREEAWQEYNESVAKAELEYREEVREIEADHEECLADVRGREAEDRRGRDGDPADFFDGARFVGFTPDGANDTLLDFTVRGVTVLDEARYLGDADDRRVSLHGSDRVLEIRWDDDRVRVHDNPTGLLQFKADDDDDSDDSDDNATRGGFLFDFIDSAIITPTDDGARIEVDGRHAILVAPQAEWLDNDTVVVTGFASLHLPVRGDLGDDGDEHDDAIEEAIAARRVAAQVALGKAGVPGGPGAGNGSADVLAFDDVDVSASGNGSRDDPFRVLVGAELDEGRTIAISMEDVQPGQDLDLGYYDVHADGTRTQVVFAMADSLQDVLDPTNDEGQPEYWVVHDAAGAQVLVSIPNWSVHEVTLAIGDFVTQPSVIAGAIAGVLGSAVAATAMLWPRRVRD